MIMANEAPLWKKNHTGNESPNQIVVAENQEVGNDAFLSCSPHAPAPISKFSKLDKMG